jgi:hypothetical protein
MSTTRKVLFGLTVLALSLGPVVPARALEWGYPICQRCGQPIYGESVPAPLPDWWPRRLGWMYRKRCCPPAVVCPPEAGMPMAPPAAVEPALPPTEPGAPQPERAAPQPGAAPTAPTAPTEPTAPGAPTAPEAAPETGAPASGLGGALASRMGPTVMYGDLFMMNGHLSQLALSGSQFRPPPPPEPPPVRNPLSQKSAQLNPSVRSFKIANNQTPFPVDRITYSFNFFDYVNQSVNQRFQVPISHMRAYQHNWGFEKTFWDQNASFGMRIPLNTLNGNSNVSGLGQNATSLGDLSMYFKYAFWMDRAAGRVFSGGMALTAPTGPAQFAGAPYLRAVHYTMLQPYIAFQWTFDRLYLIGFSAVDVPTGHDVTMYYNDLGLGYYAFRNEDPEGLIQMIAPIFETHVNTPLTHRDVFNARDIAGTADVVNLTEGLSIFFRNRSVLSMGIVNPVTGPRPFSLEALVLFNMYF